MVGHIYIIKNKINNKVYIGQTMQPIKIRFTNHIMSSRTEDTKFYRAIRKYGETNFYIELLEDVEPSLLNEREIYWIEYYNSYKSGYNSTLGGDGTRKIDYNQIFNKWNNNLSCSQIAKKMNIDRSTVSRALKGVYNISEEEIAKRGYESTHTLSNTFIKQKWDDGLTPNQIYNQYGGTTGTIKKVLNEYGISEKDFKIRANENQRNLTSEQIKELWNKGYCISEIQREYGSNFVTIRNQLFQNGVTSEDINNRKRIKVNQNKRSVVQLSLNNEFIKIYDSMLQAEKETNIKSQQISGCCRNKPKYKTAGGYKWMYLEDYETNKIGLNQREG